MKRISIILLMIFYAFLIQAETYKMLKASEIKTLRQARFRCESSRGQLWLTFLSFNEGNQLIAQLSTKEKTYHVIDCTGDKTQKKLCLRDNESGHNITMTISRDGLTELDVDLSDFDGSPVCAKLSGAFMMEDGPYCRFLFGRKPIEIQKYWLGGSIDDFFAFLRMHFEL